MKQSFSKIRSALERKEISSFELTRESLQRSRKAHEELNCYYEILEDTALAEARAADELRARGMGGPLTGVPYALKDLILAKGFKCTAGSRILENFEAPYDAHVVEKLKKAGTVLIGKTSLDEFGMGSSNENSFRGPVRNPIDPQCSPGGSSGGSAAAVASGSVSLALGTDTGGSIRQPASFCGIVGLKPTYGRVSRYGLLAFASSLDSIGPMASDVEGCAFLLEAFAGKDDRDATSSSTAVRAYGQELLSSRNSWSWKGRRVGLPRELTTLSYEDEVVKEFAAFKAYLVSQGAQLIEVDLKHAAHSLATYYLICTAEASSNLSRYDGVHVGRRFESDENMSLDQIYSRSRGEYFGLEVRMRILLGTYVLSSGYYEAYYKRAAQVRRLIYDDFKRAFSEVEFLLSPTSPERAFALGARTSDPLKMYASDLCTLPASLAGVPAISFPSTLTQPDRPIGMQLMAPWFGEMDLLLAADHCEHTMGVHDGSL
jgi:aspartyl-tRNA(Asn)/glutamyl-tRNA(Gln) amidotransferase subunit A